MKTQRELQLALGKLLTGVKNTRNWSEETFTNLAKGMGIARTEASRFYSALVDMDLLRFDKLRNAYVANFNVAIWQDEDTKLGLIRELMEMFPIRVHRGRVKGKSYPKKTAAPATMAEVAVVLQEEINPLSAFSAQDLVRELRERGYTVSATKQVMVVEEL